MNQPRSRPAQVTMAGDHMITHVLVHLPVHLRVLLGGSGGAGAAAVLAPPLDEDAGTNIEAVAIRAAQDPASHEFAGFGAS